LLAIVRNDAGPEPGAPRNSRRTVYLFLVLRMIVAAFVVGAGIMIIQMTNQRFPVGPLYALLIASVITGGIASAAVRLGASPKMAVWTIVVADIVLEAAIVHFSGGSSSQFSMIYCLTIVAAAFMLEVPGGLATAILSSLCFIGYGVLESLGIVVPPGRELVGHIQKPGLLDTYMHLSLFFLVGTVGGILARHIQLKGRQLEDAEIELEQLKVDTDYILRNMSSGILVTDSDAVVITMNPAAEEILGVTREAVVGRPIKKALGAGAPELAVELEEALRGERSKLRHEITVHTSGARQKPLGTSISLMRDGDGEKRGVISVFQDLTEVHEMRERVRKADRLAAIGELSAGIAHELRNPLASISGSIEVLAGDLELSDEHAVLMELITRESDRLDRIISDFLEFARLRYPSKRPVEVDTVIEEVLTLLRHNPTKSSQVRVELTRHGSIPAIRADDEQIRQVFTNLAVNSCEAMVDGGTLEVEVRQAADAGVAVAFRDTGPGIDEEFVARLFEPFFTTKDGGTGLGLAIANKIVMAHGGTVEFHNREGGGAEFLITLPVGRVESKTGQTGSADAVPVLVATEN
jgi:two-component system sensor histidine kinase PilS (NtrC family)